MKFLEQWLREWTNPLVDSATLGQKLTSLGIELEAMEPFHQDTLFEVGITPNRGDCLSIQGIARELAAGFETELTPPIFEEVEVTLDTPPEATVQATQACPLYTCRLLEGVDAKLETPDWMRARLEAAGVAHKSFIVDVANYVMLELGQPVHAFDADKIKGSLTVRMSHGETVTLIDDSTVTLDDTTLVIADDEQVVAIAGVMGTSDSAVSDTTNRVILESAFFTPASIAGRARRLGLKSDAAQRFERGVDPHLPSYAMERVSQLLVELGGGEASKVTNVVSDADLPQPKVIKLPHQQLESLVGMSFKHEQVLNYFERLNMDVEQEDNTYFVTPPSYRFDMTIPQDLVEECVRLMGYDAIPEHPLLITPATPQSEARNRDADFVHMLVERGYHEVITYSFVDKALQNLLYPDAPTQDLINPIASHMGSMRVSLWPGLLQTLVYNQNRQQPDLRLVETGQCFESINGELTFSERIGGLISGACFPLNWGYSARPVDFFDIKGDVEALLARTPHQHIHFVKDTHPVLADGQTARIFDGTTPIGWVGALHPAHAKALDIKTKVFLFELDLSALRERPMPQYAPVSKFPHIRRDVALLIDKHIESDAILGLVQEKAGPLLKQTHVFDVYMGEHIEKGKKSIALGLILSDSSRTLIDEEVNSIIEAVVSGLKEVFGATVRE